MIDHIWTVLCTKGVVDKESNNISLFEVIEELAVSGKQSGETTGLVPIRLELVSLWMRGDLNQGVQGFARIRFRKPDGSYVGEARPFSVDLNATPRSRTIGRIEGVPVSLPGRYEFIVELQSGNEEWRKVATVPLFVAFRSEGTGA